MEEIDISPKKTNKRIGISFRYLQSNKFSPIISSLLVLIILVIALIITLIVVTNKCSFRPSDEVTSSNNLQNGLMPARISACNQSLSSHPSRVIIGKSVWAGKTSLPSTPLKLKHPTPVVIIAHTASPFCYSFHECCKILESAKNYGVWTQKYLDIRFNFLIAGDGNVYVGHGWDDDPRFSDSLFISFMGNYTIDQLTEDMIDVAKELLEIGVNIGKLSSDYILVAHNQTANTVSPGTNIYRVIKTWPHFDPRKYELNAKKLSVL